MPKRNTLLVAASLFALLLTLVGCGEDSGEDDGCPPETYCECVGSFTVIATGFEIPDNYRVEADGSLLADTCQDTGVGIVEIEEGNLLINSGGFGYSPPPRLDVLILDLGDCSGEETEILNTEVENPGSTETCANVEATVNVGG